MRIPAAILLACMALSASAETLYGYAGGAIIQQSLADLVAVPDCSGMDEATCVAAVEGEGFTTSTVAACSNTVASGDVISTQPPAGVEAEVGSTVIVRVSNGEACSGRRPLGLWIRLGTSEE